MRRRGGFIYSPIKSTARHAVLVSAICGFSQILFGQGGEPSRNPILRIETQMHTAAISRISTDSANRFFVTGSHDKTIRVWEASSGKLMRVIRPPMGSGDEGKIFAVAITPDGQTIAAAGSTGYEWEHIVSLYLFDRASGRLLRRVPGFPEAINHLTYSADGRFLAVMSGIGMVVLETSGYKPLSGVGERGGNGYGADFDLNDRLVTSSLDGYIRLYEILSTPMGIAIRQTGRQRAAGGTQPVGVKFSPDGSNIAIGFADTPNVNVLNGRDMSPVSAPDTTGVKAPLPWVTWSSDGNTLFAAGYHSDSNNALVIRIWVSGGRGRYQDLPVATNAITQLLPLRDGGIVYSAFDPAYGVISNSGKRVLLAGSEIADYRDNWTEFTLSADGDMVGFSYTPQGKAPANYSVSKRQLNAQGVGRDAGLLPPKMEGQGISVTGWRNSTDVKLNGQPLKLDQYETARSFAVSGDSASFVLGTDFFVHYYDRAGSERWRVQAPATAWAANVAKDGRSVVLGFGDGTIRWYRTTDGKELMAFFPHADRNRWVLWTPDGYYDSSPGAESLIGWQVNNGKEATADFFPVGQFRSTFYRPDVIAGVLPAADDRMAFQRANEASGRKQVQSNVSSQLPPVVEIVSPADNSDVASSEVTIRYQIRTPSGEPVTTVKALVNGRPVEGQRQLTRQDAPTANSRELHVSLSPGDSEVSVIAENRYAPSTPAKIRLRLRPATAPKATESFDIKPRLYILAVGVSHYQDPKYNLAFADKDARDFVASIQAQKGLLYKDIILYKGKPLTDAEATKDEVLDGLDWIRKETTSNDVAMVYFAGHGVNDQNNLYYFCPYNIDPEKLLRTGVAFSDIKNTVSAIAGKALFFVDTCHSGNSLGLAGRRGTMDINIVINELSSAENGVVVFSASTGSESSYEKPEWNNGAFTKALVEGLNGAADLTGKGRITYAMLNVYISDRVKELTRGQQHPTMISPQTVPDFPVAVKK